MTDGLLLLIVMALLVVFWAVGGYLIFAGLRNRRLARASEFWPVAGGTVLSSEIGSRKSRSKNRATVTYYLPKIRYGYRVAGTDYESSVIRFGDLERTNATLAEGLLAKYPAGATVSVRYDPADPSRATLETESAGGTQIWAGAVFIVAPLIILIGLALIGVFSEDMQKDLPPETLENLNRPN